MEESKISSSEKTDGILFTVALSNMGHLWCVLSLLCEMRVVMV